MIKLTGKGFSGLDDFKINTENELPTQSNTAQSSNINNQRTVVMRSNESNLHQPQQNYTNTQSQKQTVPQSQSSFFSKAVKIVIGLFVVNFALNWLFESNIQSTINNGLRNKYRTNATEKAEAFRGNLLLWDQTRGNIDRNQSSIESSLAINRYLNNYSCVAVIRYSDAQVTQYKGSRGQIVPGYQKVANITVMDRQGKIIGRTTIRGTTPPESVRVRAGSSAYYGDMGNGVSNWASTYPNLRYH